MISFLIGGMIFFGSLWLIVGSICLVARSYSNAELKREWEKEHKK